MNWTCTLTEERLSDVLDARLSAAEASAYSAHAAGCDHCTRLIAQVGSVVQRVRQLPQIEEPPFLASRIISATRGSSTQKQSAKGWFAWLPAISPMRLAMGVLTVAASFFVVFHALSALPHRMAFNPVNLYYSANRHIHLTYARGVKIVNDLRVVYVIQSRLFAEPQPSVEPTPAPDRRPEATPEQHSPDSDALPKSQAAPPAVRRTKQSAAELAVLIVSGWPPSPLDEIPRSYL